MKKFQIVSLTLAAALLLAGCGASESAAASGSTSEAVSTVETAPAESESESEAPAAEAALPDDIYTADFNTDSSMFHVNEACNGKGTLTVENGEMTMHVSLQSQKIVNLYLGMAADAPDHEDEWLQPTIDTVTYSDGTSDEVYGFDIPVAAVDTDFQLAILGTKGTWYDHVVSVSNAVPAVDGGDAAAAEVPADGTYTCAITLEGGSGRDVYKRQQLRRGHQKSHRAEIWGEMPAVKLGKTPAIIKQGRKELWKHLHITMERSARRKN